MTGVVDARPTDARTPKMNTSTRLLPLAAALAFLLVGCQQTPAENAKKVSEARQEAAENVAAAKADADKTSSAVSRDVSAARTDYDAATQGARGKLSKVEAEAMAETARADYDVATAQADGMYKIAKEKCGILDGVQKTACQSGAEAQHQQALAYAAATRDAALARADWRE